MLHRIDPDLAFSLRGLLSQHANFRTLYVDIKAGLLVDDLYLLPTILSSSIIYETGLSALCAT
jgi:hypothetical protein